MDRVRQKGVVIRALGAMSGTSLDGVDAAVLETDGVTVSGFGPQGYRGYDVEEQGMLRAALGQWSGPALGPASEVVMGAHVELLTGFANVDLVGFHGQTAAQARHPAIGGRCCAGAGPGCARGVGFSFGGY